VVGKSVVDPEDSSRNPVGYDDVHSVVTTGNQHKYDADKRRDKRCPVQRPQPLRRVFTDDEIAHGEHDGMATVNVVTTVSVFSVDT